MSGIHSTPHLSFFSQMKLHNQIFLKMKMVPPSTDLLAGDPGFLFSLREAAAARSSSQLVLLVSSDPAVISLSEQCKLHRGSQLSEKIHNHNCFGDTRRTWAALRGSGLFLLLRSPFILEAQEFRSLTSSQPHSEHTSTLDSCIVLHGLWDNHGNSNMKTFSHALGQNSCRTQPAPAPTQTVRKETVMCVWERAFPMSVP